VWDSLDAILEISSWLDSWRVLLGITGGVMVGLIVNDRSRAR
jgi:hypothetical protein